MQAFRLCSSHEAEPVFECFSLKTPNQKHLEGMKIKWLADTLTPGKCSNSNRSPILRSYRQFSKSQLNQVGEIRLQVPLLSSDHGLSP